MDDDQRAVLLPDGVEAARLIVCEQSGRWAAALRRELALTEARPYETRSLARCWDELAMAPASIVVVELRAEIVDELLGRMARLHREFPLACVAVVADRSLCEYEPLMREASAVYFTCSPRRLGPLAGLACQHLAEAPVPRQTVAERIWSGLPWKEIKMTNDE